jgi:hypothetical protein
MDGGDCWMFNSGIGQNVRRTVAGWVDGWVDGWVCKSWWRFWVDLILARGENRLRAIIGRDKNNCYLLQCTYLWNAFFYIIDRWRSWNLRDFILGLVRFIKWLRSKKKGKMLCVWEREMCLYWINSKESLLASVTAGGLAILLLPSSLACVRSWVWYII